MKLTLPGVTPSQNEYDHWHWGKKHAYRNEWFWTVLSVVGKKSRPMPSPVRVCFTRVSKRLIDHQNVGGPVKPLLDAFVEYGLLAGDDPKHVGEFATRQRKCAKGEEPHMEVEIEMLDPS